MKARYVIGTEGKLDGDKFLMPGSVKWPEDHPDIPVTVNFRHDMKIGYAREFQRDEATGELSVEIEFIPGAEERWGTADRFGWSLADVKGEEAPGLQIDGRPIYSIVSGRLNSVAYLGLQSAHSVDEVVICTCAEAQLQGLPYNPECPVHFKNEES